MHVFTLTLHAFVALVKKSVCNQRNNATTWIDTCYAVQHVTMCAAQCAVCRPGLKGCCRSTGSHLRALHPSAPFASTASRRHCLCTLAQSWAQYKTPGVSLLTLKANPGLHEVQLSPPLAALVHVAHPVAQAMHLPSCMR